MRFSDAPNTATIICKHCVRSGLPILFVSHDEDDGAWQFLCNVHDHDEETIAVVALHHVVEIDPSVTEVADLPLGHVAERPNVGQPWYRHKDGE